MKRFGYPALLALVMLLGTVLTAFAQEPDVIVGEVGFPERVWGEQRLPVPVTNQVDWLKYLVVENEVSFEGSYVEPLRVTRSNFVLEPGVDTIYPILEIPPNYGQLTLLVRAYDVIDTLDDLSLGTKVLDQVFKIRFHTPQTVVPYFQDRLSLPPLVGYHGMFDNEFSRLMLVMIQEGKTVSEIADLCQTDTAYVRQWADRLVTADYLVRADSAEAGPAYRPAIPVITEEFAVEGREIADRLAERLSAILKSNLDDRHRLIDSLVTAGVYSGDSNNFFEGGTLLYRPYPLVSGLYLWRFLGQRFVTGEEPLLIYQNSDPCEPQVGPFMYLVQGGDYYTGHHYYSAGSAAEGARSHFGDRIPDVDCYPSAESKVKKLTRSDWEYTTDWQPESFLYDTVLINPAMRLLNRGVEEVAVDIIKELEALQADYDGSPTVPLGTRYWFWNLAATRTLETMVDSGVVSRLDNGQYRYVEKKL